MGAWIETGFLVAKQFESPVAPLMGAWIETCFYGPEPDGYSLSHLSWVRGLKQN